LDISQGLITFINVKNGLVPVWPNVFFGLTVVPFEKFGLLKLIFTLLILVLVVLLWAEFERAESFWAE
jgi:hypothetical protein